MTDRKDSFGYGVTLPRTTARVIDAAAEIMGDRDPQDLAFLHTVLEQIRFSPSHNLRQRSNFGILVF